MQKWRRIGRLEWIALALLALYLLLRISGVAPFGQFLTGMAAFMVVLVEVFRLAQRAIKKAIWRLRNRLLVAYLFIAVVPVVLIVTMVTIAAWALIGQMAVYLVNTELRQRELALLRPAEALARVPAMDPELALNRFAMMTRHAFPEFEMLITGRQQVRYPPGAVLTAPPPSWQHASGLVVRQQNGEPRLFAWAHVAENGEEVTVMAPITAEVLNGIAPGLGDIDLIPLVRHTPGSHLPPKENFADISLQGPYPIDVPFWDDPHKHRQLIMLVRTRPSAVLRAVFPKQDWSEIGFTIFVAVSVIFLVVELVSLIAGVKLSRTITGAVHDIYAGTQRVKEGDFAYRIPVKGADQLAEMAASFNTMTANLGRLIVVAKEKERLESELTIAREVQNQLFPKDVPFTKTLELKGVCSPARMVSGDYYDFMAISDQTLAFAIGDVAGKGISAALLMASIQSTMRTQLQISSDGNVGAFSVKGLVSVLNKQLYANTTPEKYATFYFAIYEETTHALTYTNAGHLAPMLVRGNNVEMLDSTGTVVGAFPIARYEEKTVPLEHGDILVCYTDGIVEPENAYGEMFGEDRLKDMVLKHSSADSSEIIARVMEAVVQWTGAGELQDDMTMVMARRL